VQATIAVLVGLAVAGWLGSAGPRLERRDPAASRAAPTRRDRAVPTRRDRAVPVDVGAVAATGDLVALALDSGVDVDGALEAVARCSDGEPAVANALRVIVAARRWGIEPGVVLAADGREDPWAPLLRALHLADAAGVPPAAAIRRTCADLRATRRHRLEVATARLRVRVVLPLGLCFLPAFVCTTVVPVVLALAGRVVAP